MDVLRLSEEGGWREIETGSREPRISSRTALEYINPDGGTKAT